jgi:general stress protein YciG
MTEPKKPRGFAAMTPEQRREISSRGGRNTPPEKRNFSRDPASAVLNGSKGGKARHGLKPDE